ncbi:MAG: bifunctional phosphoribosylaminoimidazolecarboxamide formyltransferase/IMP cyclohydrolase [Clostridiales bacterium]|nr:bifunctional phosphoribosylaminoimidazolecarboxamide formyltransferase/IMP cyclohydrolase [Clostridiales bacterium]
MKKRAIISLTDKTGVVEFARSLVDLGFEILSTGGTWKVIHEAGIPVTQVSDVTGFPECLDGRVKTLHPMIHAGILAMRSNPEHMEQIEKLGVTPIDVVAINLYPFKQTVLKPGVERAEVIENIDIGGPTMLRAAAKNYQDVSVIVDPADYDTVIEELRTNGAVSVDTNLRLAYKVFNHTAAYDTLIQSYLRKETGSSIFPDKLSLTYEKVQEMRYGENPHQGAAFYKEIGNEFTGTLAAAEQLHGKELSYNNINDTNGALDCLKEFGDDACVVAVKHANPCGVGIGADIHEAYMRAYNADPVSIFGGIIAANREIDAATAAEINKIFVEIVVAPSYTDEALEILCAKKNIRVLRLADIMKPNPKEFLDMKKVAGGLLIQERDDNVYDDDNLVVVTEKAPTEAEMVDLRFAMKVVKHTKSNAIVLAKNGSTVGVGPGQTNRITALELAVKYANSTDGAEQNRAAGSVMASDAFFPFSDCVECAAKAGITAIIQPGGSIRDQESIDACNRHGIAMVFTGVRHFKH